MTITRITISTGLATALLLAFSNVAMAKKQSATESEMRPCKVHERNAGDCHIHDQQAFLHMRLSDARLAGKHADQEYRKLHLAADRVLSD